MGLTVNDLQPKPFQVTVKGVELTCQPLRLSHALVMSKIGDIFQNPDKATRQQIKQAEADMDEIIGELIPELKDTRLDVSAIIDLLSQMMTTIQPDDAKTLEDSGVKFDVDPKAEKIG